MSQVQKLVCLIACFFLLSGCGAEGISLGPKKTAEEYLEKRVEMKKPLALTLENDSGIIEIYTWNKEEVFFEITKKIRGTGGQAVLENGLKDWTVTVDQNGEGIRFRSVYRGKIRNPNDRSVDVKVHVPRNLSAISCTLDIGRFKIMDGIEGTLNLKVKTVNSELHWFQGRINLQGDMGNLVVDHGRLLKGSSVRLNHGNMTIQSEFEDRGSYDFKTGIGNIDLTLPEKTKLSVETNGNVTINQFIPVEAKDKMKLTSEMGRITIQKASGFQ